MVAISAPKIAVGAVVGRVPERQQGDFNSCCCKFYVSEVFLNGGELLLAFGFGICFPVGKKLSTPKNV